MPTFTDEVKELTTRQDEMRERMIHQQEAEAQQQEERQAQEDGTQWDDDNDSSRKHCFYCGGVVAERMGAGDHFPKPKATGGTATVHCCVSCHDMKDRFRFEKW